MSSKVGFGNLELKLEFRTSNPIQDANLADKEASKTTPDTQFWARSACAPCKRKALQPRLLSKRIQPWLKRVCSAPQSLFNSIPVRLCLDIAGWFQRTPWLGSINKGITKLSRQTLSEGRSVISDKIPIGDTMEVFEANNIDQMANTVLEPKVYNW